MRVTALAVLLLTISGAALANPVIYDDLWIDFDPAPGYVAQAMPAPNTICNFYVVMEAYSAFVSQVSFKLEVTAGGFVGGAPEALEGWTAEGSWDTGVTLTSVGCDTLWYGKAIYRVPWFYTGPPGEILIEADPVHPRWFMDCGDPPGIHIWCVLWHGAMGTDAREGDCTGNAVRDLSWAAIKGLYRR
jgi:hypothetical protein